MSGLPSVLWIVACTSVPTGTRMSGPGFESGFPSSAHAATGIARPFSPSGRHNPSRASSLTVSTLPLIVPAAWRLSFGAMDSGAREIADVRASARKGVKRDSVVAVSMIDLAPVNGGTTGVGGNGVGTYSTPREPARRKTAVLQPLPQNSVEFLYAHWTTPPADAQIHASPKRESSCSSKAV